MSLTPAEQIAHHCRRHRLPRPSREYRFVRFRTWRLDVAWPELRVAVEIQGGTFMQGHHSRGKGQEDDFEKLAHAVIRGWRVLFCTPGQVERGPALSWIERVLRSAMNREA